MNEMIERDERWVHGLSDCADDFSLLTDGIHDGEILKGNTYFFEGNKCKIIKYGNTLALEQSKEKDSVTYKGEGEFGHYNMKAYKNKEVIGESTLHETEEGKTIILEGWWKHSFNGKIESGFWRILKQQSVF